MEKILIIGGNAAGLTAASRAKRLSPRLDVTVIERLPHISYSTCGLPYLLSGQVRPENLISFTPEEFEQERGIKVHSLIHIDTIVPGRKMVEGRRVDTGEQVHFPFEKLLIATGVKLNPPEIPGTDLANVYPLLNLQDAIKIREAAEKASHIAIIGGGYVGLEAAECLWNLGKKIVLYERNPYVLGSVDEDIASIIEYELRRHELQVMVGANVLALTGDKGRVNGVKSATGLGVQPAELVLLDTGVAPNTELAQSAGIHLGRTGAIAVDSHMETNLPGVYAAGNCAESFCVIRRRPTFSAIGTVAAKQGRVAGENLAGRRTRFRGAIGTTILKVFQLGVGRTGLTTREAAAERMPVVSARIESLDRASYYPGARKVWIKLIASRDDRRLVGAQAAGYGEVARRIDVAATAISAGMRVEDLAELDLGYAPPFSSLWDPLHVAVQALLRRLD
jgi:NADPH-dependent 2,4-dienoyl-CoA reductase/sulfur reductase-like enzyme